MAKQTEIEAALHAVLKQLNALPQFCPKERKYLPEVPGGEPSELYVDMLEALQRYSANCAWNSRTLGYVWNNAMRVEQALTPYGVKIEGARVLEIGCGVHNPLGSSMMMLALGAKYCEGMDGGPATPKAGETTQRLFSELARYFPAEAKRLEDQISHVLENPAATVAPFRSPLMRYELIPLSEFNADTQFDIVHSNATLEHLLNYDECIQAMHRVTAPGGYHVHKVDFIDHEFYNKSNPTDLDAFTFLFKQKEGPVGTTNRLRAPQLIAAFERNGFEMVHVYERWTRPFPEKERPRLAPQFRNLEQRDIETLAATLIFRRK